MNSTTLLIAGQVVPTGSVSATTETKIVKTPDPVTPAVAATDTFKETFYKPAPIEVVEEIVTHVPVDVPVDLQPITQPGAVVIMTETVPMAPSADSFYTVYEEKHDKIPTYLKVIIALAILAAAAFVTYQFNLS